MVSELHYRILGIEPGSSLEEIKRAYHRVAKKTHPDLVSESQKDRAAREMMRVNRAYMALTALSLTAGNPKPGVTGATKATGAANPAGTANPAGDTGTSSDPWGSGAWAGPTFFGNSTRPEAGTVGHHRDPAYVYYKRGFAAYQKGYTELFRRDPKVIRKQLQEKGTYDLYILSLALKALRYFEEAYDYFFRVTTEHGRSPWATDARYKLRRIQRFNEVYQRICNNISRAIRKGKDDAA